MSYHASKAFLPQRGTPKALSDPSCVEEPCEFAEGLRLSARTHPMLDTWPLETVGIPVGFDDTGLLRAWFEGHRLILGGSGSGKFTSIVAPMALHDQIGSDGAPVGMVFIDIKDGEATRLTRGARLNLGRPVYVLDPMGMTGAPSQSCNPLTLLDPARDDFFARCRDMSHALIGDYEPGEHERYFRDGGAGLMAGVIGQVCLTPDHGCDLIRVRTMLMRGNEGLEYLAAQMIENNAAPDFVREAGHELKRVHEIAGKELSGYLGHIRNSTAFLNDPRLARSMQDNTFSWRDLRDKGASVYIATPDGELKNVAPWIRLMLEVMKAENDIAMPGQSRDGADIHVLLDEAAALGGWAWIENGLRAFRSNRISLHLFYQNLGQIKGFWPEKWTQIMSNECFQFLGSTDPDTCKWVAEMIGETTVVDRSISDNDSESEQSSVTQTDSTGRARGVATGETNTVGTSSSRALAVGQSKANGRGGSESNTRGSGGSITETSGYAYTSSYSVGFSSSGQSSGSSSTSSGSTTTSESVAISKSWNESWTLGSNWSHTDTQTTGETNTTGTNESRAKQQSETLTENSGTAIAKGTTSGLTRGSSESWNERRRLPTAAEIRMMSDDIALIVYRNRPAKAVKKLHYFRNPVLLARVFEGLATVKSLEHETD